MYIKHMHKDAHAHAQGRTRAGAGTRSRAHSLARELARALASAHGRTPMVSSHKFNLQKINFSVSNPRTIAYVHIEMPCEKFESPRGWAHISRLSL